MFLGIAADPGNGGNLSLSVKTEIIAGQCIVCDNTSAEILFPLGASYLARCGTCGLQYLSPRPDQAALDLIYEDYYSSWNLDEAADAVSTMKRATFLGYLQQLPLSPSNSTLLDVGCATGEMLEVAASKGFDVYGAEISPHGKAACKARFGENKILGKNLEHGDFPENFFDVITLCDVIEHIANPPALISVLASVLKPGGLLMIITPDTSSWTLKALGKYWPHYKPEHLYYFNHVNLSRLCSSHFEPVLSKKAYKTLNINYITGILSGYAKTPRECIIARLLSALPKAISRHNFRIHAGEMLTLFRKHG